MKRFIAVVAVTLVSGVALAESVKEKKAWDAIQQESKAAAAAIKEKCGVEISVMPDRKSWDTVELAEGPARWCVSEAQSNIPYLCDDADYKAAIAKTVKKITCINDPKLPNSGSGDKYGNKFSMKNGAIEWRYHKDSGNLGQYLTEFLKEHL